MATSQVPESDHGLIAVRRPHFQKIVWFEWLISFWTYSKIFQGWQEGTFTSVKSRFLTNKERNNFCWRLKVAFLDRIRPILDYDIWKQWLKRKSQGKKYELKNNKKICAKISEIH